MSPDRPVGPPSPDAPVPLDAAAFEQAVASPRFLLFKHSLVCPISAAAFSEYRRFVAAHPDVPTGWIDVIGQRPLARGISERTGIRHESPQAMWFVRRQGDVDRLARRHQRDRPGSRDLRLSPRRPRNDRDQKVSLWSTRRCQTHVGQLGRGRPGSGRAWIDQKVSDTRWSTERVPLLVYGIQRAGGVRFSNGRPPARPPPRADRRQPTGV